MTTDSATPAPGDSRRVCLATAAAATVVILLVNWPIVLGRVTPKWDADGLHAPWFSLIADHARAGRLMTWNPWSCAGSPDFANPECGAMSPLTVGVAWLVGPKLGGFLFYWMLLWIGAAVGVVMLARRMGAPPWGGFVVALGFAFSGFFTGQAQHIGFIHALTFLPWIIERIEAALRKNQGNARLAMTAWGCVQAGALWGLSALAGYTAVVALTWAVALLWIVGRCLIAQGADRLGESSLKQRNISALVCVTVFTLVGLVILSPTYTAFLTEAPGYTDRAGQLSRELAVFDNALHPGAISTLASPYLPTLVQPNYPKLWAYNDQSSCSIYVGAVALSLAGAALVLRPRSRWRWWLAGAAVFFLILALGRSLPVRGWLYDWIPLTRYSRHPSLFRDAFIFLTLALALHASSDIEKWRRSSAIVKFPRGVAMLWLVMAALAVAAFAVVMSRVADPGDNPLSAKFHLGLTWGAVVIAGGLMIVRHDARRIAIMLLVIAATIDAGWTRGLSARLINDPTEESLAQWRTLDERHDPSLDLLANRKPRVPMALAGRVLEAANKNVLVKVPSLFGFTGMVNRHHERWFAEAPLGVLACGDQRIWFAPQAAKVPTTDVAMDALVSRVKSGRGMPILVHAREQMRARPAVTGKASNYKGATTSPADETHAIDALPAAARIGYRLDLYQTDALSLTVDCPCDGWLLVTDRWANGWRANVNDQPVEVMGGNFTFRAVAVKGGMNTISFWYAPAGFPQLLIVSWGLLAVIAAASAFMVTRHRSAAATM